MKKPLVLVAVLAVMAMFAGIVSSKTVGVTYTDALVIPYNGTATATISAAGALVAVSAVVPTVTVATKFVPPAMSSTTIATHTFAVGEVVYNTTRFAICVGTAAGAGYAVFQSSNPITIAGVSCKE